MRFTLLLLSLLLSATLGLRAQETRHQLLLGTQFPLQMGLGYHYRISPSFSLRAQAGVLTSPYDDVVLGLMRRYGADERLTRIVESSFGLGGVGNVGLVYHRDRYRFGIQGGYVGLHGQSPIPDLMLIYYGPEIGNLFLERARQEAPEGTPGLETVEVTAITELWTAGITGGRQFTFRNPRLGLLAEIGLTRSFRSTTAIQSNYEAFDQHPPIAYVYSDVKAQVKEAYRQYGWLPTVNVYLTYYLGK